MSTATRTVAILPVMTELLTDLHLLLADADREDHAVQALAKAVALLLTGGDTAPGHDDFYFLCEEVTTKVLDNIGEEPGEGAHPGDLALYLMDQYGPAEQAPTQAAWPKHVEGCIDRRGTCLANVCHCW